MISSALGWVCCLSFFFSHIHLHFRLDQFFFFLCFYATHIYGNGAIQMGLCRVNSAAYRRDLPVFLFLFLFFCLLYEGSEGRL